MNSVVPTFYNVFQFENDAWLLIFYKPLQNNVQSHQMYVDTLKYYLKHLFINYLKSIMKKMYYLDNICYKFTRFQIYIFFFYFLFMIFIIS